MNQLKKVCVSYPRVENRRRGDFSFVIPVRCLPGTRGRRFVDRIFPCLRTMKNLHFPARIYIVKTNYAGREPYDTKNTYLS